MSDNTDHRWSLQQVKEADAKDRITHSMTVDSSIVYYFTPGGIRVQDKSLHCALEAYVRHQVPLCCRVCKAGLGSYIYSKSGNRGLSDNQKRKNRNIMLFGKSHLQKAHGLFALRSVPLTRVGEPNVAPAQEMSQPAPNSTLPSCTSGSDLDLRTSIPQAQMVAKNFRARATSVTLPTAAVSIQTAIPGTGPGSDTGLTVNPQQRNRNTAMHELISQFTQERPSVVVLEHTSLKSGPIAAAHSIKRKCASSEAFAVKRQKICDKTNLREVSTPQRQDPTKVETHGLEQTYINTPVKVCGIDSQPLVERKATEKHALDIAINKEPNTNAAMDESNPSKSCVNETNTTGVLMKSSPESSVVKKQDKSQQGSQQAKKKVALPLVAEGLKFFNAQSYDKALCCFLPAAAEGSLAAQYSLARMYKHGLGVERSWTLAMKWYMKAAELGYPVAQVALGEMYERGSGLDQSLDQATEWYRKAAESDDNTSAIRARINLALMRGDGERARKYTVEEIQLFHHAASLPDYHDIRRVLHELGTIYYTGHGFLRNKQTGLQWWQKAADKGNAESDYRLGCAFKEMNELRFSVEHWTKAAERGHCEAAYNLGNWYAKQKPQAPSLKQAMKWWLKAAKQGHANAQHRVAILYETGTLGFKQSAVNAQMWYQRAAEQSHNLSRQKMSEQSAGATTILA